MLKNILKAVFKTILIFFGLAAIVFIFYLIEYLLSIPREVSLAVVAFFVLVFVFYKDQQFKDNLKK